MSNSQSTVTLQQIVRIAMSFPDLEPVLNVGGNSGQPALTIANDVMNAICSTEFPFKWNEIMVPQFYTNSYQQDYAVLYPSGASLTTLAWLERGIVVDINNTAEPKPFRQIETGRQLPQATGSIFNTGTGSPLFLVNFYPNKSLYYGTWGDAQTGNNTFGNNPTTHSVYTNPLGNVAGMPANPITQIQDANGNLLVLTTYGEEGTTAPLAAVNAAPGTTASGSGATTVWTVADPNGQGMRILPVPSQTGVVWQFNVWGQAQPVRFTTLNTTLSPLPDYHEPNFRQMFIAQCYRYSPEAKVRAKFKDEWQLAMQALVNSRTKEDRELEENVFVPDRGIMARSRNRWVGPQYPFNYPYQTSF